MIYRKNVIYTRQRSEGDDPLSYKSEELILPIPLGSDAYEGIDQFFSKNRVILVSALLPQHTHVSHR